MPTQLQRELVERAAVGAGSYKALAGLLDVPKSSVHYYMTGRLTMPVSLMERMLEIVHDADLERRVRESSVLKDRTWANTHAAGVYREMCRGRVTLPTRDDLDGDDDLRRKAAAIVSYVMAEGSIWIRRDKWDEGVVNITFAEHETDLYEHFATLCRDVFRYDIGPPQPPGNGARAIRGFIYSRFVAEWLLENGVPEGEKSAKAVHLPGWVVDSDDRRTLCAAVQPWFDGEGSVTGSRNSDWHAISMSQARHTDLDFNSLPRHLCSRGSGRVLSNGTARRTDVYGIPVTAYCGMASRSEIFDDVVGILRRLGYRPRRGMSCLRLNDSGFWSCIWHISIPSGETRRLVSDGIVTQKRKREAIVRNRMHINAHIHI